jgi:hypothetical protein
MNEGVWYCQAGCGKGGLLDFEMKLKKVDREQARNSLRALGINFGKDPTPMYEAAYSYLDEQGVERYQIRRVPKKPNGKK